MAERIAGKEWGRTHARAGLPLGRWPSAFCIGLWPFARSLSWLRLIEIGRRLCAMLAKFIHRVEADIARDGPTPKRRPGRLPGQRASERPKADAEG